MPFDVRAARDDLPSARAAVYLNAGSLGPLPRITDDAMRAHMTASFARGRIGQEGIDGWLRQMEQVREGFAGALGAHPDTVALMHCTTDGINTAVWGLPWNAGDSVLTTTHEHAGLTAPLEELARTRGVEVRAVEPHLDAIAGSIDGKTKLVALSHVLWTNGETLPIKEIAYAAHAEGALVLVDGAQSAGAIPVDPAALGADLYTVSGQKWFCGPSGTGALWVRPGVLGRLRTPWPWYLSKSRGPAGVRDWPTARRLDATTLSMTSMAGIIASLIWHAEQVEQGALGWAEELARSLRKRLLGLARVRVIPALKPSSMVSFTVEGRPAAAVATELERHGIFVRSIPGAPWVRASVGFWNDEEDVDRLVRALG